MLRDKLHEIIFEAETKEGRLFDVALLWIICLSVLVVVLDSVPALQAEYHGLFAGLEWAFTIVFCIEYLLRAYCIYDTRKYVFSFMGIIDFMAVAPSIVGLLVETSGSLLIIRAFRLLRIFRIFKLGRYVREAGVLRNALEAARPKITVFMGTIIIAVTVMGTLMYLIEGEENGFTSIPVGIYWAIVTMTTVGYGDIVPQTVMGKSLSGMLMIMGYGILAVPTGIVSVELAQATQKSLNTLSCPNCAKEGHDQRANYCDSCGFPLV